MQDFNGVWTCDLAITGAMLYQLSYEATDVGSRSIVGSYVPVKEMSVNDIWNKSYMNCGNEMEIEHICSIVGSYVPTIEHINPHMNPQLTCSQRQWRHSSVGRASHRYRKVMGLNPVEVLNFFSGFFTQLHKLHSLRWSFLHFHFISPVHIWFISYIINKPLLLLLLLLLLNLKSYEESETWIWITLL